jgi:SRSO17 transposase
MRTTTRDTSDYGYHYLSGLLRMKTKRNITNIALKTGVPEQNMQQFISDSPWSGYELISVLQQDISNLDHFQEGAVLLADESAEEKAGEHSVGSSRQHNGRLGKVEMSQVGVFLSLAKEGYRTWIDGELFLPKKWFTPAYAKHRQKVGLPKERTFQTKLELVLVMVKRAIENGVLFDALDCDALYGRSGWLRDELGALNVEYYGDIPRDYEVYLEPPHIFWEPAQRKGAKPKLNVIGSKTRVEYLSEQLSFETITLRPNERGMLTADFARRRVWTVREDGSLRQEWLLLRRDKQRLTYSLSNAPADLDLWTMASRKSHRYFIERAHQDAKSELGWDEFQARKYRAWVHHLALTIMASAFITETLLDWAEKHPRDPDLLDEYDTDTLPNLSIGNVRELLRAVMPLPQLTPHQAAELVVKHLDNRTRSRKSRLRKTLNP